MPPDLFDGPDEQADWVERWLRNHDEQSFVERCRRLRRTIEVYPDHDLFMPGSSHIVFSEARTTFINGDFASTLLVAQAFIEHRLQHWVVGRGEHKTAKRGLSAILEYCRTEGALNDVVIDGLDELRRVRNPFAHLRSFDDPDSLFQRVLDRLEQPDVVMEADAFRAFTLMLTVATTRLPGDYWPFPHPPASTRD